MNDEEINKCHCEWKLDPNGYNSDAIKEFIYEYYDDGHYWMKATVRWDECIEICRAFNSPMPDNTGDVDSIHICGLTEFIEMLNKLKEMQDKYFNFKET